MLKTFTEFANFANLDIRVGTILSATLLPNARTPAYVLDIDFGAEIGRRTSSAQITELYNEESVLGRQVVAIINFPVKQIGKVMSECLVLGIATIDGVALLSVDGPVPNGLAVS